MNNTIKIYLFEEEVPKLQAGKSPNMLWTSRPNIPGDIVEMTISADRYLEIKKSLQSEQSSSDGRQLLHD